ncbi:hypothetical protein EV192_112242 [Actinocrispum wychmicini]|uniref:Uncharacterized protein n=1 Tax=Actinocrispum wychmicini TaxID=1213861 RepID=A0A4V2S5L1_9PSEU|nr:hypothetical protein EV192_112242 [Actinocrispum wychmicini]
MRGGQATPARALGEAVKVFGVNPNLDTEACHMGLGRKAWIDTPERIFIYRSGTDSGSGPDRFPGVSDVAAAGIGYRRPLCRRSCIVRSEVDEHSAALPSRGLESG